MVRHFSPQILGDQLGNSNIPAAELVAAGEMGRGRRTRLSDSFMGLLLSSGVHVRELSANAGVVCVAFAGQNLYPVLGDGRLCVWTFESQQPPRCSEAIAEPVSSAGFSGDVRRVLIGSRYSTLLL
jgi:hypothetical protein